MQGCGEAAKCLFWSLGVSPRRSWRLRHFIKAWQASWVAPVLGQARRHTLHRLTLRRHYPRDMRPLPLVLTRLEVRSHKPSQPLTHLVHM
jgi:hypothetical protein